MPRSSFFRRVVASGFALAFVLAAAADAQYSAGFGKNKIQYRNFAWKTYKSPHFVVYYYEDEQQLLEKVVSYAESAYDRLSREFDHQIQEPIPLIFFATHSAFEQNNIIVNFIPENIGAFASPVRNRMVLPVDLPDGELFELITHELTHVFQYSVIFQSKFGRGLATGAPQWFMEGMASYMAKDEGTMEKMFLRDAVVNDAVPSILERGVGGYMSYRFGHAAFDYIEERWGKEGFRDFVYEFRNTIGGRPDKAIERSLRIKPEDFDLDFRRWLRKKYLPELVATGEPSDFGRPFRDDKGEISQAISPSASPSGDLVAALAVTHGDLDVVLYDARERKPIANLSKGFSDRYQYLISQHLTSKARMGRDLAFSPDGNRLAVFAKREKGRSLVIFDVLKKKVERVIDMDVEQQHAPAFSTDGTKVALSGNRGGRFDIFLYDLESGEVTNLTDDEAYDGAPVFTPDGRAIVYSSTVGYDHAQLWRMELSGDHRRTRITEGPWSDQDAIFSSDGKWLYFSSDRSGVFNIWGLELATGKAVQYTNAITGCFMPTVQKGRDGSDRLVYAGFWNGDFDLYMTDLGTSVTESQPSAAVGAAATPGAPAPAAAAGTPTLPAEAGEPQSMHLFEPDIQVSIDEANKSDYKRSRLFLEDGGGSVGVTSDQLVLGQVYLSFSDYLGDRRLFATLNSVDTFSDFDFLYINLSKRTNWSLEAFDSRSFFIGFDQSTGRLTRGQAVFRQTGLVASLIYPISFYHRAEAGTGFIWRSYQFQQVLRDPDTGEVIFRIDPRTDEYPVVQGALVGDTTRSDETGPVSGRRWRLSGNYGYDTDGGGTLSAGGELDFRQYLHLSDRTQIAIRAFGAFANGSFPNVFAIGGLDTLRAFDFRSLVGDRVFFTNLEFRFPLLDALVGPFFDFRRIRGRIFLDVGGAWRDYAGDSFRFWDSNTHRLLPDDATSHERHAVSAYGWGFTVGLAGLDLNWDFAQAWDFKGSTDRGFRTSFWIGTRF